MADTTVKRLASKKLLTTDDFPPTDDRFQVIGVFNPGAERLGPERDDEIVLMVRVAQGVRERLEGYNLSPRSLVGDDGRVRYEIDRLQIHAADNGDHRKPLTVDGLRRLAFVSHLELIRISADGYEVKEIIRTDELFGRTPWEEYGVEDPRITKIDDTYWITYVGVSDQMGVATQLMSTKDFRSFERHGVMFVCENKDVVIFPEKLGGSYHCYHRPVGHIEIRKLAILSADSPDMIRWGGHKYVLGSRGGKPWYSKRIGAGTPPVKTPEGWLSIFHGVRALHPGDPIGAYTAGAMLSALDDPARILGLSEEPFFQAEEEYERKGYVGNVVFPTGIVRDLEDADRLHVYYGCADSVVAVATFSQGEILASLKRV